MSFLKFTFGDRYSPEYLPKRIFAKLDNIEPEFAEEGEQQIAYFEAIDAAYVEDAYRDEIENDTHISEEKIYSDDSISVVEIVLSNELQEQIKKTGLETGRENIWMEFIEEEHGELEVDRYYNLFLPPIVQYFNYRLLDKVMQKKLSELFSMENLISNTHSEIQTFLDELHLPKDGAAVYDVGQGNCNSITDSSGMPALYYDFGGVLPWWRDGIC